MASLCHSPGEELKGHVISSGVWCSGYAALWQWRSWCTCTLTQSCYQQWFYRNANGISDPNVIKFIPRISLLTLLELHGKNTYPVVRYAVDIESTKKKKKSNKCMYFLCNFFKTLELLWRGLPDLYFRTLYQELFYCKGNLIAAVCVHQHGGWQFDFSSFLCLSVFI